MNNKQESRFSMYLATTDFCDQNATVTATLPNFSPNLTGLKSVCEQIHLYAGKQSMSTTGSTAAKNEARKKVVMCAADTSRKIVAWAKITRNLVLLHEVDIPESELKRMPDTTLMDTGAMIYQRADDNMPSLVEYLVSEATQLDFQTALTGLNGLLSTPRVDIVDQTQITAKLIDLFIEGDGLLADMDAVVEVIRSSEANYYLGYHNARKVIVTGTRKLAVKGLVTDAQSGEPVPGVIVSFWLDGNLSMAATEMKQSADLMKKTAQKGRFNVATLPTGTYRAKLQKAGYVDQTVTIYVNDGELTVVDVTMGKV